MGEEEIGELFGKDWPALKEIYLSIWREMQIKIKLEMRVIGLPSAPSQLQILGLGSALVT